MLQPKKLAIVFKKTLARNCNVFAIPFLTVFKVAKIIVKLVRMLKASKSGFKILYKAKKALKYFRSQTFQH